MKETILYFAPGSCSRVAMTALFETSVVFETRLVRFMKGEHKSSAYKSLNPKGKIPAIVVDGEVLTENVAILSYLNQRFPAAALLPPTASPVDAARQIADLCFCSATLHPLVTRIRMPGFFAGPEAAASVWQKGCDALREHFQLVEDRLAGGAYWYGDAWSMMDAYLNWVFWRVQGADFPVADYPRFADHALRVQARPSHQRAMDVEAKANATLEAEGLAFKPERLPA